MRGHGRNALGRTIGPLVSSARGDAAWPLARGAGDPRAALELLGPHGRNGSGSDRGIPPGLVLRRRGPPWCAHPGAARALRERDRRLALGHRPASVAARGLVVLPFGLVGVAGAILYTVPPVRAAYRPFAGEAVAFICLANCVIGAHVLQGGPGIDAATVATAVAVAAYAVGM